MNFKILIIILFSVIFSSFVSADLSDFRECLALDNDFTGYRGDYDAESEGNTAITFNDSLFKLGTHSAYLISAQSQAINWSNIPFNATANTFNFWVYPLQPHSYVLVSRTQNNNYAKPYQFVYNGDGNFQMFVGTGSAQEIVSSNPDLINQNKWTMVTYTYNNATRNHSYWINGEKNLSGTYSSVYPVDDTSYDLLIGKRFNGGVGVLAGYIDEVSIFDRVLSDSEIEDLWNSGNGVTCSVMDSPAVASTVIQNTSILVARFNHTDFTFNTNSFFNAMVFEFNTSETTNLTLLTAFNTEKLSSGATNVIVGRVLVNGVTQITENLRTVSDIGEVGATGFYPVSFEVSSGSHNITIQLRRTLAGVIEVSNIDTILIEYVNEDGDNIRNQQTTTEYEHTETDYARAFNWTISENNNSVFMVNKQTVTSTGASNISYLFLHIDDLDNSTEVARYLSSASDIGSISNLWVSSTEIQENFTILSKTNAETITVNTTIIDFDLEAEDNDTIQSFSVSNTSSNIDNRLSLGAGIHNLITREQKLYFGDGFFLGSSISFRSLTGTQTPRFIINSTNSTIECYSQKDRYLEDNTDIGNAYLYTSCINLTVNQTYDFQLWAIVGTGETLEVIDETLTGFDISELSISEVTPSFTMDLETDLVNNTINYNNDTFLVWYNFTVGEDNSINLANCTLTLNNTIVETQTERNASVNYLFNYTLGDYVEINASVMVNCSNAETFVDSGTYYYSIDTINPILESTETNLSTWANGDTISYNYNCSDSSLFAMNDTIRNADGTIVFNQFSENLTGTLVENSTSYTFQASGNHTTSKECWDSHSAKKVKPINWEVKNNASLLIAQDLKIWDSDLKYYNNNGDLVTYLALAENEESYKIKFTWETTSIYHSLKINSSGSLIPIFNRKWKGHFVYNYQRGIDIEGDNVKSVNVTKQTGYYLIEIELYNSSDELETRSVFDLNYVTLGYTHIVLSEVGISNLYLEDINNTLANLNLIAEENRGGNMYLWIILFVALFFILGIALRQPLLWNFSGIGFLLIGFYAVQLSQSNETLFNFGLSILFWTLGLIIMLVSSFLYIKNRIEKQKKSITEFYQI